MQEQLAGWPGRTWVALRARPVVIGPAAAEVRLRLGAHWLTVEVCDTGRGPAPGGNTAGHGLVGMRERRLEPHGRPQRSEDGDE